MKAGRRRPEQHMKNENLFASFESRTVENSAPLPPGMITRPAQYRDAPGLAALRCEREGGDLAQHEAYFREEIRESSEQGAEPPRLLLVAEQNAELLGYARASYFEPPDDAPANTAPAGMVSDGRDCGKGASAARNRRGTDAPPFRMDTGANR